MTAFVEILRILAAVTVVPVGIMILLAHRRNAPIWLSAATGGMIAFVIWTLSYWLDATGMLPLTGDVREVLGTAAIVILGMSLCRILWYYAFEQPLLLTPQAAQALADSGDIRLALVIRPLPGDEKSLIVVRDENDTKVFVAQVVERG